MCYFKFELKQWNGSYFQQEFRKSHGKPPRWSLFSIKIQALMPTASLKRAVLKKVMFFIAYIDTH